MGQPGTTEAANVNTLGNACPLTTSQLTDLIMQFVVLYNEPAGIHLYAYQRVFMRRIITSILKREGAVITGLWSRQSGKSEALSSLASALCIIIPTLCKSFPGDNRLSQYMEGFWVGIFAPKQQQSSIIYERIRKRAERDSSREIYHDPDIQVDVSQSRGDQVSWTNGSFVAAQTASEQSNVEGKTYHLVIIDEAQLVGRSKVAKEIAPMLAATNGTMVKIGTANALQGGFRESIIYNNQLEKQGGSKNHFEFPYDVVILEKRKVYDSTKDEKHLNYERWVKVELARLGGNLENEEFRMNFRLMWQEANVGAIDKDAFIAAMRTDLESCQPCFNMRLVAGLDYAKKRDATILTIMSVSTDPIVDTRALVRPGEDGPVYYEKTIIAWYEIAGRKWHDILGTVVEKLADYSVDTLVADATGVGDPLTETMQGLVPGIQVIPFIMSHVGNDLLFKLYIQEMEAGRIKFAAGEETFKTAEFQEFVHEHDVLIKDRMGVHIRCYAPEGEHDDYCDSAALACYGAQLPRYEGVDCEANPFYASRGSAGSSRADRYRHR